MYTVKLAAEQEKELGLQYGQAAERLLDFDVATTGQVMANANLLTHVTAPLSGRVRQVFKSAGDHVREGEPLLEVRSTDIEQAEADLLNNESQVRADLKRDLLQIDSDISQGQAQIRLSEATFRRSQDLVKEKIASRADYEAARTQYEKDKISLESNERKRVSSVALSSERLRLLTDPIRQKLRLLGESDGDIDMVLKTRKVDPLATIVSPHSGIVSERLVNVGELVDPAKALFTVGDYHNVWLQANIVEKDITKVKCGQPIRLSVDSFPGEQFSGRLNYISDTINPETRTLVVRAEVDNPGLKLKPKMFARMTILVGEHLALTVPRQAVQYAGAYKVVYVPLSPGCFEERRIQVGRESGGLVEVVSGVRTGERVVAKGSAELSSEALKVSG